MLNSNGKISLQKRSKYKGENPGLYDKTIGGHVSAGNSWELTVAKECAEELGFPAIVLLGKDFAFAAGNIDLRILGIFRKVAYLPNFNPIRVTSGKRTFIQLFMTTIYICYYGSHACFADAESGGIETFALKELRPELEKHPEKFTEALKFMAEKYGNSSSPQAGFPNSKNLY